MSGRNVQAIPVAGPIPLPLYEFGDEEVPEDEASGSLTVHPFDPRPHHLGFDTGHGSALLDRGDVVDLIHYCQVWLRAERLHSMAAASAARSIRRMGEREL